MLDLSIIKRYIRTEKSGIQKQQQNTYSFQVEKDVNKIQIKEAIENLFKVKVMDVRTMIIPGKAKRLGRYEGKTSDWKKAIVKLKKGTFIKELEG